MIDYLLFGGRNTQKWSIANKKRACPLVNLYEAVTKHRVEW